MNDAAREALVLASLTLGAKHIALRNALRECHQPIADPIELQRLWRTADAAYRAWLSARADYARLRFPERAE